MLRRRLALKPRVKVPGICGLLKSRKFPLQVDRPPVGLLERPLLEPAIEILLATVELRLAIRDERWTDAEEGAPSDHPRQGACRLPPAGQLKGVVELDLFRPAQALPALAEEPQDLVHLAGRGPAQAEGPSKASL